MALAVSLEHYGRKNNSPRARILGNALDQATEKFLEENKSPSRKVGELDTRGSHFFLALYWAEALASQDEDADLKTLFKGISDSLSRESETISGELLDAQGTPQDIGGYYLPDAEKVAGAMRPSATFNKILDRIG
jgi:isocitrate dehydrogenase